MQTRIDDFRTLQRETHQFCKMFAVMPYDTEDRSAAYRRRVATPRADFVCKYCQRRFTKVSMVVLYLLVEQLKYFGQLLMI